MSHLQSAGSEEAFDTLNETMKSLSESAKSINSDGDISEEELSRLWNKLGISGEGQGDQNEEGVVPEVFSLVTNLMQNLLSKQVLYPSIKDLSERVSDHFRLVFLSILFIKSRKKEKQIAFQI